MSKIRAFDGYAKAYDRWFDDHPHVYKSELNALKLLLPKAGEGLEVGVGTGRFAAPLGIKIGVEPSKAMREIALARDIKAVDAVAETLPFASGQFDFVLFVTTVCFLDELEQAFKEAYRVLKAGGAIVIGLIDKNSPLGERYDQRKHESRFYKEATFHSTDEVATCLLEVGFSDPRFVETIFHSPDEITEIEPVAEGYGNGSFVVVRAVK